MKDKWAHIEDRLKNLGCLEAMKLNLGATESELDELEQHIGLKLPESFRQFLNIHNGQGYFGLAIGSELLSTSGIRDQWNVWRSIDEKEMNDDCAEFMASNPPGVIKALYCNPHWIGFTHDGGGNHYGFDFDPDTQGQVGQVITFGRDEDTKRFVSSDFEVFLSVLINWLDGATWNGEYLENQDD